MINGLTIYATSTELSILLLASKNILTDLTDLEWGSRKQNDLAKGTPQSVQMRMECQPPDFQSRSHCFICGGGNESYASSDLRGSFIAWLRVAARVGLELLHL